jgi:DNA-binding CsgD family transcriptional regulator
MTGSEPLLRQWVDYVAELLRAPEIDDTYVDILRLLSDTFEGIAAWNWLNVDGNIGWRVIGAPKAWPPEDVVEDWLEHQDEHPLIRWFGTTHELEPMTMARVPWQVVDPRMVASARARLASDEVTQQLAVPVLVGQRQHGTFVMSRGGADYTDDQLWLAGQLQPLLMLVERQRSASARMPWTPSLAERHDLTGREVAVLALLAEGLTACAISGRLGCSARTVQKHLENAYRKLGVRDRLSAIRYAESLGEWNGALRPAAAAPDVLEWSGRLPIPGPLYPSRVAS